MQNLLPRITYFLKDFAPYFILITFCLAAFVFAAYKISKSISSQKKKNLMLALCATVFALVLGFSLFEAYFRYVYDQSDGLGFLRVNQKWHERHVVFNNYFFRDRDFDPNKQAGVTRIGVLGDSITQGDGIKNVNNRFSNLLERKLQQAGYKVEVYNLGKAGYDTEGEIETYSRVKNLNFDIIIWQYFINDIQPKDYSTGSPIIVNNSRRAKILEFISKYSYFLDYLYWRYSTVYDKTLLALRYADINQYSSQDRLQKHQAEITDFIESLRADDKKVVVVMFPSIMFLGGDYPIFTNDIMHKIFEGNQVETIDLYEDLKNQDPEKLRASRFDTHPNEIVHALAAQKLYEKVTQMLDSKDSSMPE